MTFSTPERAIAYRESDVIAMLDEAGLTQEILPGFQNVVFGGKPA